jgi:hypothetical protein
MSEFYLQYQALRRKLRFIRWTNNGYDSEEEDAVLDEMDDVWWKLSESERAKIDSEKPISVIRSESGSRRREVNGVDRDTYREPGTPVRNLKKAS